ncbi:MAG: hypothetical protein M1825_005149 [Sarcosagium campestre]|nr:MAG: hypothetical protein M1825_005149 [Sarcosagium campestre]
MTIAESHLGSQPVIPSNIPIIDFSTWLQDGSPEARQDIAHQLASACRQVGFVYITNHGVDADLVEQAFDWTKKLFDLPRDQKMLAPHPDGAAVHRGYSYPGLEKVSQVNADEDDDDDDDEVHNRLRATVDHKESYEVGSETNADQPNVWLPDDVLPGFQPFMTKFYWECADAARRILRVIAVGLGLSDADFLLKFHSGNNNQLRLLHYPPIPAEELESQRKARMPAHSDWGSITFLFQDDTGGLQVEDPHRAGRFIDAPPLKDTIVMNVGDLLMRWSNDFLKSTLHRVTLPPSPNSFSGPNRLTRARYSIPYFVAPDPDLVIESLPTCVDDDKNPAKYPPITQREWGAIRSKFHYKAGDA